RQSTASSRVSRIGARGCQVPSPGRAEFRCYPKEIRTICTVSVNRNVFRSKAANRVGDEKEGAMGLITTKDGEHIYYKEWGKGDTIVFSHGWPLSSDAWEDQMFFLASKGYRCIAHDRRGHGRSTQTWDGNDMDTYADDLAALVEALDLE